jgi:hypothetical protein
MESIKSAGKAIDNMVIEKFLQNPYLMAVVKITLVLYASQLAPKLPHAVSHFFQNTIVKIVGVALIAYFAHIDFQLAIILAVALVLATNKLSGRGYFESFADYSADYKPYGDFKLIEPHAAIYPGCVDITMDQIVAAFDGDHAKLKSTVNYAYKELLVKSHDKPAKDQVMQIAHAVGLPYNVDISKPENASYLATLLVNAGFQLTDTCRPPQ